jgi:hypothetical protein
MTLNFPNPSRSYDMRRNLVRFWGHDGALEVAFFVPGSALDRLSTDAGDAESEYLAAFDTARDRIHEVARKTYARGRKAAYMLAMTDF